MWPDVKISEFEYVQILYKLIEPCGKILETTKEQKGGSRPMKGIRELSPLHPAMTSMLNVLKVRVLKAWPSFWFYWEMKPPLSSFVCWP